MSKQYLQQNYIKITSLIGLTSVVGLSAYEIYKVHRKLNTLVNTKVLDIHKKGPEYIYIKHHIYRKSLEKELKAQQGNFVNIVIHPFGKWWKKFQHSLAWRLLRMAQEGDHNERIKAITQLALIDHLKDWDFQHLAQLCDHRTAVALARSECDTRWFLRPRFYGVKQTPTEIALSITKILEQMKPNLCIEYALDNALALYHIKDPDADTVFDGMTLTKHESDLVTQTLDALLHLTTYKDFCEKFIEARGLEILVQIEKLVQSDVSMRVTLCRIIANITEHNDYSYHFFVTGWIGLLAKWAQDEDMRVQVTALLALANLDREDNFTVTYPSKVYPLYPRNERKMRPNVDVIFVHGLLGGVFITWRQKKSMKPEISSITNTKSNAVLPKTIKKSLHFPDFFTTKKEQESSNINSKQNSNKSSTKAINIEEIKAETEKVIPMQEDFEEEIRPNIADTPTQEIMKAFQEEEGIGGDWEVVYHDVPKNAVNDEDCYSVSGEQWLNEESRDEFTYCWPMEWLSKDFPASRIIGLNYESSLTQWYGVKCPCLKNYGKLTPRATEFLEKISKAGVGQRPIVWVGHSMGGLLIKSIIVQASQSDDPMIRQICNSTKGIIFLGTPHRGSPVAKLKQHISAILWPSIEVQEMKEDSYDLLKLNDEFLKLVQNGQNVEIASLAEGRPTIMTSWKFPILIVTQKSARCDVGEFYLTSDDHLGLSKPMCRQSFLYQRLAKLIKNSTKPLKKEVTTKERDWEQEYKEVSYTTKQQMYHMLFNFG